MKRLHEKMILGLGLVALLAASAPSPSLAEVPFTPTLDAEPSPNAPENPWSTGVSKEKRVQAEALFKQGNGFLKESIFVSAVAKYREALKLWFHPNIQYNLSLALMNLDQPLEVYDHLHGAVRFGPGPLGQERYEHAKNYLVLLEKQVARVKVTCSAPGGTVEMDGKRLFAAPGQYEGLVRPGIHTMVAQRPGFVTNQSVRMLEGGKTTEVDLELKTLDDLTRYERRWASWVPWTILGTGLAVAAGGGALQYLASHKVDSVNEQSKSLCPTGCSSEPASLSSMRSQAASMQKVAVGAYAVGGAGVVVGGVLAYLNRARAVTHTYDSDGAGQVPRPSVEVAPAVGAGGVGVSATGRF
jgi:hypothetical protein